MSMPAEPAPSRPWWVLPSGRIHPAWWLAVAPVLIWFDYASGPETELPVLYVLPVCVAAWYSGQRAALALAVIFPLAHVLFMLTVWAPFPNLDRTLIAVVLRATVVVFIALMFARQSEHERQLRRDLERRHALEMRAEQLRVVQVTMRTVQDIVNNCLNQLLLLRMDAEGRVSPEALETFDQAIKEASSRLNALADLEAYAEKQMEIGTGLDVGQ
jgi:K+-sensing histidine kinase KdpD